MDKTVKNVIYLEKEDLTFINKNQLELKGGFYQPERDNLRSEGSLEYIIDLIRGKIVEQPYPTFFNKAAAYFFRITKGQIFNDGNKRTGANAAFVFLDKNGFKIKDEVSDEEIIEFSQRVADGKETINCVVEWLKERFILKEG